MAPLIAIVIPIVFLAAVAVVVYRWQKAAPRATRFTRSMWIFLAVMVLFGAEVWLYLLISSSILLVVITALAAMLYAVIVTIYVFNWHNWGKVLWNRRIRSGKAPPYHQPEDPRLRTITAVVAPIVLVSSMAALVVLIVR